MKKAISAVLVVAMLVTGAGSTFAYTPSDINDPKCINTSNLNEKRWISLPEKPGKKVCGCKTCEVNVMTFDKIPEYIEKVQKELKELDRDIRTNENKSTIEKLEDCNKAENITSILDFMKTNLKAKNYLYGGNVYLTSMNNEYDGLDSLSRFDVVDGITYESELGEDYFNSLIPKIDEILRTRDEENKKNRDAEREMSDRLWEADKKHENRMICLAATGAATAIATVFSLLHYANNLRKKGRITNRALLYICDKLYGPISLNNQ